MNVQNKNEIDDRSLILEVLVRAVIKDAVLVPLTYFLFSNYSKKGKFKGKKRRMIVSEETVSRDNFVCCKLKLPTRLESFDSSLIDLTEC